MREIIDVVASEVKKLLEKEATGHDWHHMRQVRDTALLIAESEGGDKDIIELAALVHDVGDRKFNESEQAGHHATLDLLARCGVPSEVAQTVADIARRVSFKGANVPDDMPTLEGKIVQDADRLYALGAIGLARTFAYGGKKGKPIYDPDIPPMLADNAEDYYGKDSTTINHFYEKLLLLKDRMHTKKGREMAEKRTKILEDFLAEFMREWEAKE